MNQTTHTTEVITLDVEERRFELEQRKAKAYTTSLMLPQHLRDIGSMMVLNQMSRDLKIPMLLLAQNIYMVKGKLGMSAQLVITLINGADMYDTDLQFEERSEPFGVKAYAIKDGNRVDGIWIDEEMIIANGWYSNSNWKTLKPLMARYRAASYFARLNCPTVLMGMQTDEEIIDVSITETPNKIAKEAGSTLNQAAAQSKETDEDNTVEADIDEIPPGPILRTAPGTDEVQEMTCIDHEIEEHEKTELQETTPGQSVFEMTEVTELDELKEEADHLGIRYAANIGIETLKNRIREHYETTQ